MTDKKKIIIVDDHNMFVDGLSSILSQEKDIEIVLTSSSAKQIVKYLSINTEEHIDLVITDINMPEMNGLDATEAIRTFNNQIPIIALTAVEEGKIKEQALSVGMNDVIVKPYDTQQFFQTIMKNISKVKSLQ